MVGQARASHAFERASDSITFRNFEISTISACETNSGNQTSAGPRRLGNAMATSVSSRLADGADVRPMSRDTDSRRYPLRVCIIGQFADTSDRSCARSLPRKRICLFVCFQSSCQTAVRCKASVHTMSPPLWSSHETAPLAHIDGGPVGKDSATRPSTTLPHHLKQHLRRYQGGLITNCDMLSVSCPTMRLPC